MTHTELNFLPHRTPDSLNAIPSISLKMTTGPKFLVGSKTRVFDSVETPDGWDGCQRNPRNGDFMPRQLFARANYELA